MSLVSFSFRNLSLVPKCCLMNHLYHSWHFFLNWLNRVSIDSLEGFHALITTSVIKNQLITFLRKKKKFSARSRDFRAASLEFWPAHYPSLENSGQIRLFRYNQSDKLNAIHSCHILVIQDFSEVWCTFPLFQIQIFILDQAWYVCSLNIFVES